MAFRSSCSVQYALLATYFITFLVFATIAQSKVVLHDSVFFAAKVCFLLEWWFLTSIDPVGIGFNVLMHLSPHGRIYNFRIYIG